MKQKRIWIILLLVVLAVLILLWRTGFFAAIGSLEAMKAYVEAFAPYSHIAFFLIQYLSVVLAPIPSNITALAGGMLFGFWGGFLLSALAIIAGSMTLFALSRKLGAQRAAKWAGEKVSSRYLDLLRRKQDVVLFFIFLFPFFPDDVICILAGLTTIRTRRFFILMVLSRPWGMLISSALGSQAFSLPWYVLVPLIIGGIILFLAALRYGDRWEELWIAKWNEKISKRKSKHYR